MVGDDDDEWDVTTTVYDDTTPTGRVKRHLSDDVRLRFSHLRQLKNASTLHTRVQSFLDKSKGVHGDKYDYSKVEYVNAYTEVIIICPIHGEFQRKPREHLYNKSGCRECLLEEQVKTKKSKVRLTTDIVVQQFKETHGDKYDYSRVEYVNAHTKVIIICPIHGEFQQKPHNHKIGQGCLKCGYVRQTKQIDLSEAERLLSSGLSYHAVSKRLGTTMQTLKRHLEKNS